MDELRVPTPGRPDPERPDPERPAAGAPGPRRVVAADLEGTCTTGETWRGVGRWLEEHGRRGTYRRFLWPRVAALPLVRIGLVERQSFRDRWIRDLARCLAGLPAAVVDEMAEDVVLRDLWPRRRQAVLDELEAAASGGASVVLASGTYQPVLERFAARFGHGAIALGTQFEVADGRATGRIVGLVGTGPRKAARVAAAVPGATLVAAFGDSAADIPMLEAAVAPVAVVPDAGLRRVAVQRGWRVVE